MKNPLKVIWHRTDRLVGKVLTGILAGKFIGDWTSFQLTRAYGTGEGLAYGVGIGVGAFILYPLCEEVYEMLFHRTEE